MRAHKNWCRPYGVRVVAVLSPLRGSLMYHSVTHGLRRGLHSFAASRLGSPARLHFIKQNAATTQTPTGLARSFCFTQDLRPEPTYAAARRLGSRVFWATVLRKFQYSYRLEPAFC